MRTRTLALSVSTSLSIAGLAAVLPTVALAADPPVAEKAANQQVIVPEVDRRDIRKPRFPSNDFEVGVFGGTYATQNFGSSAVGGLRVGYHITEDVFVEAVYAQTKVSDEAFRQVLPGGVFAQTKEKLSYYNVSAGYNLLPGEVFFGSTRAKASAIYLIGGVGSTKFNTQRRQTINFGLGARLFLTDKAALQIDMRDHVFSLDILGKRQSTQNLEMTGGFTYFF
jgi:outer membrane beta-barrel protein